MLKRSRYVFDTPDLPPSSPATKRARVQSSPIRPHKSHPALTPSPYYKLRTPFSVPSDSPSNPFGLKRSLIALDLPRETSFRKHITLRLQLVDKENCVGRNLRGGVYRIVQVPLNYTFRHIHKLILFVFAPDIDINCGTSNKKSMKPRAAEVTSSRSLRSREVPPVAGPSKVSKGKARAVPEEPPDARTWGGHYFEAQKHITLHQSPARLGHIKAGGKTWAKLSSVRERRLFRDLYDPLGLSTDDSPNPLDEDEPDQGTWRWEAEDDLTMAHVWPKGQDLDRGFIYYHSPSVSVHVTINTLPVEPRRGHGNTPHVFLAQGSAGSLIQRAHVALDEHGNEGTGTVPSKFEPGGIAITQAQLARWNELPAFKIFLEAEAKRERNMRRQVSPSPSLDSESLPPLLFDDRSSSTTPDPLPSSEAHTLATSDYESDFEGEPSAYSDSVLFPFANSAITPYPAHPLKRRRVEREERRMEKLTRSGMREVMSEDEEEARKRAKQKVKAKAKREKERKAREKENARLLEVALAKERRRPSRGLMPPRDFSEETWTDSGLEVDEEGNVRDLLGIYESEV